MECCTEQGPSIGSLDRSILFKFSKVCVVVRSEMDVFDRFTSKA